MARTRKEDRDRLVGKTPKALAENVCGIGEHMAREADRAADARDRAMADPTRAGTLYKEGALQSLRVNEAHVLAHSRAELLAVCDEMRARIDHLLAGKDIGDGRDPAVSS